METKIDTQLSLKSKNDAHSIYALTTFWLFILIMILFLGYLIFEHFYFGYSINNSVLIKDSEMTKEQLIQYQINRNILHYMSIFTPIILAVFSGIFGLFTYTTNQNLRRSENILERVKLYSEQSKKESKELVENFEKNTTDYLKRFQSDMKNIRLYPSEVSRQVFILFNRIIPKEKQPEIEEVIYLLDLMDESKAVKACLYLKERGSCNSIPFMKEYQEFYKTSNVNIANQIKIAIIEIEKRKVRKE